MNLKSLESLTRSESRSRNYLVKKCWAGKKRFCVRCHSFTLYRLADGRYRCGSCRYTFQDFTGRWIGTLNLAACDWLWLLKLFELEIPARQLAGEVGISYPTALKALQTIRCAIAQYELNGRATDSSDLQVFFRCRGAATPARRNVLVLPIFGVRERSGRVQTEVVNELSASELFDGDVKIVKRGSILCTDRYQDYDALLLSRPKHFSAEQLHRPASGRIYIDRLEGFWSFANVRLFRPHAMVNWNLPLYLKELEFRYNHRAKPLFELLVDRVVGLVPNFLSKI